MISGIKVDCNNCGAKAIVQTGDLRLAAQELVTRGWTVKYTVSGPAQFEKAKHLCPGCTSKIEEEKDNGG